VDIIRDEKPPMVFFENVRNITNCGDEDSETTYSEWFVRQMREMERKGDENGGYGVNLDVKNAADYGVPQRRKRTIGLCLYGVDDEEIEFPEPTHAENPEPDNGLKKWATVEEWIKREDLKQDLDLGEKQVGIDGYPDDPGHRARRHRPDTVEMMQAIPDNGGGWRDLRGTDHEHLIRDCHKDVDKGAASAYGRMSWDDPAPTLTTRCANVSSGRFTHPVEDRSITFREAALLMSFPRWFELPSKNGDAEQVVGNAVPPIMITSIVSEVTL